MYTNNHTNTSISSYGYGTKHPFMTVHADKKSLWTVDQIDGSIVFEKSNTIKIKEIDSPENYKSVSVYRTDIVPGCAHVSLGEYDDVFIPVNMTTRSVCRESFGFFFTTVAGSYYCLMVRSAYIKNQGDIEKYREHLHELAINDYKPTDNSMSRHTISTRKGDIIIFAFGTSQHPVTFSTNNGKRILACFEKYSNLPIWRHVGLDVKTLDKPIHTYWKILKVKDKWYKWIYICDSPVAIEEYIPENVFKKFNEFSLIEKCFMLHREDDNGNILATLFHEDGTFNDLIIKPEIHTNEDFDLLKYVIRNYRSHTGDRIINICRKERVS